MKENFIIRWIITMTICTIILCASMGYASDPWSKADLQREVAAITLNIMDFGTTVYMRKEYANRGVYEANFLLGRDVSDLELGLVTLGSSLLHIKLVDWLSPKNRPYAQWAFIGVKGIAVGNTLRVWVGFAF